MDAMKTDRHGDLMPWTDYFDALQRLVRNGYLEVTASGHCSYITRAALCTVTPGCDVPDFATGTAVARRILDSVKATACHIRTYAAFLSQEGGGYTERPFALHVVEEDGPHRLIATVLLRRRRVWWKPWRKSEHMDIINYKT